MPAAYKSVIIVALSAVAVVLGLVTDGTHSFTATLGNTAVDVSGWTLSFLAVTPPADSDADFALTVTATSTAKKKGVTDGLDGFHSSISAPSRATDSRMAPRRPPSPWRCLASPALSCCRS